MSLRLISPFRSISSGVTSIYLKSQLPCIEVARLMQQSVITNKRDNPHSSDKSAAARISESNGEGMELTQNITDHYRDLHLVVDFERETAQLDGTRMNLTSKTFSLLVFLIRHPGQLVPRETLLMLVWGYSQEIRTRTLDVHIRRLRKSFGKYGNAYIETIFGVGYRFQPCRTYPPLEAPATSPVMALGATAAPTQWRWKMAGNAAY